MKTLSIIAVNLCFTILTYAQKGTLTIDIEKMNTLDGEIYIGVFTEDSFLMEPILSSKAKIDGSTAIAVFENLDYGVYAISAYQDVNGNQRIDMDEYGRPTEPWAMSGIPSSMMPIWMDSKFDFKSEQKMIKLKI